MRPFDYFQSRHVGAELPENNVILSMQELITILFYISLLLGGGSCFYTCTCVFHFDCKCLNMERLKIFLNSTVRID